MGSKGMPRRYHSYDRVSEPLLSNFKFWHNMSTGGSYILAVGLFMTLGYLLWSLRKKGTRSPHNPWGGVSMEWETATPPIEHNFNAQPVCTKGPYDFPEILDDATHTRAPGT